MPLLRRALDECAAEGRPSGPIAEAAAPVGVVDDDRLGNRVGNLGQPRALALGGRVGIGELSLRGRQCGFTARGLGVRLLERHTRRPGLGECRLDPPDENDE